MECSVYWEIHLALVLEGIIERIDFQYPTFKNDILIYIIDSNKGVGVMQVLGEIASGYLILPDHNI